MINTKSRTTHKLYPVFLLRYILKTNNNDNIEVVCFILFIFNIIKYPYFWRKYIKLREDIFIKKQGPFSLMYEGVQGSIALDCILIINKSKEKSVLF